MSGDGTIELARERRWIGEVIIDRVAKRNAFTPHMLHGLAAAFTELDADPEIRVILLHARGGHFTGGLDLARMADANAMGKPLFPSDLVDPLALFGKARSKPLVMAVEGVCYTLGVELLLAADIGVAARDARFAQVEVQRSILAYGGATIRMAQRFGWGNAMRYLLTGDEFDAATAHRLGLVQELVEPGSALTASVAIAERIASAAPLAVQASLASARASVAQGQQAALDHLMSEALRIAQTADAAEGVAAFRARRPASYIGR